MLRKRQECSAISHLYIGQISKRATLLHLLSLSLLLILIIVVVVFSIGLGLVLLLGIIFLFLLGRLNLVCSLPFLGKCVGFSHIVAQNNVVEDCASLHLPQIEPQEANRHIPC